MASKKIGFLLFVAVLSTLFLVPFVSAASPPPGDLGSAGNFGILAASTVTNTGPTVIGQDLGLSPNDNTSITGFFAIDSGPGIVNGAIHAADSIAAQAQVDLTIAYNDAAGRSAGVVIIPSGELGGLNLIPGLYRSGISSFAISSGNLILDAQGNASATFIFQMPSSSLTTISNTHVVLAGNANPCNIFWQVGSSATIGTNSIFKGNILALTSITATTGASLEGRALARNGAVTLDSNNVFSSCAALIPPNSTNTTNSTNSINTTLTVTKVVINDNGGTATLTNFPLFINNTQVVSGITNQIAPGYYEVSETGAFGYNRTISGDCSPNGRVTLIAGQQKSCTITNNDIMLNQTGACYTRLKDIPAVCVGGIIMQNTDLETFDNCRHVTCVNGNNTLEITACEKPDEINPTYFEVYSVNRTGAGIQICLDSACIQNNGFATQQFPVCTGNITNATTSNNTSNQTNNTTCFSYINNIPANCTGTITQDSNSGKCRTILCSSITGSVSTLSCEKTDITGTFFEIFRRSSTGTQPQVCLGSVCLRAGWGYQKSPNFPICIGNSTQPSIIIVNQTNQTILTNQSVTLSIAPWFPKGNNYIFRCIATGFTPTSYDWIFGDGQKTLNHNQNNVYHTYANGTYNVICIARNPQTSKSGNFTINV